MKYLLILIPLCLIECCISQCIPSGTPPVVIVDPLSITITFTDFGDPINSRQRGRFNVQFESQKIGGGPSDPGDRIPLIIKDDLGMVLASVELIVGQTNTSGFMNDVGGNYATNFVPYMTSSILDPLTLEAGTYNFDFDKSNWAIANSKYYTDGSMSGSNWVSAATGLEFNIGAVTGDMEKVVDLFQGYIGRNFNGAGGAEHYAFVHQNTYVNGPPDIFQLSSLTVTQDGGAIVVSSNFTDVNCDIPGRVHDVCFYRPPNGQPNISEGTPLGYTMDATFSNSMVSSNFGRQGASAMGLTGNNETSDPVSSALQYQADIESTASTNYLWVSYVHWIGGGSPPASVDMIFDGVMTNHLLNHATATAVYTDENTTVIPTIGVRYSGSQIVTGPITLAIDSRLDFEYELNFVY